MHPFFFDRSQDFDKILILFDDGTEVLASDDTNYRRKYEEWESKKQ